MNDEMTTLILTTVVKLYYNGDTIISMTVYFDERPYSN